MTKQPTRSQKTMMGSRIVCKECQVLLERRDVIVEFLDYKFCTEKCAELFLKKEVN